jgi:hypothetical protein
LYSEFHATTLFEALMGRAAIGGAALCAKSGPYGALGGGALPIAAAAAPEVQAFITFSEPNAYGSAQMSAGETR